MLGFFTTFLMKQRLGMLGLGNASLGLGRLMIFINSALSFSRPLEVFCASTDFEVVFGDAQVHLGVTDKGEVALGNDAR